MVLKKVKGKGDNMISSIKDRVTLNNGVKMPWLGLGVWKVTEPAELDFAVDCFKSRI